MPHLFIYVTILVSRCVPFRCGRWQHEPREEAPKGVSCQVFPFLVVRLIESSTQHKHSRTMVLASSVAADSIWQLAKAQEIRNSVHVQFQCHSAPGRTSKEKKKEQKDSQRGKAKQSKQMEIRRRRHLMFAFPFVSRWRQQQCTSEKRRDKDKGTQTVSC